MPIPSTLLDAVRWLSAWAVLCSHARAIYFVDYADLPSEQKGPVAGLFYLLTGFGREAVIAFFVISGFLVGGKLIGQMQRRAFSARDYAIDRVTRIYVVLLPALALTYAVGLLLQPMMASVTLLRDPGWSNLEIVGFESRAGLAILACNVAGLQTLLCPAFGVNGPLWSLAQEVFFYATAPLLFAGLLSAPGRWRPPLVAAFAISLALTALVNSAYLLGYGVWLAGAAAAGLRQNLSPPGRLAQWTAAASFALALGLSRTAWLDSVWADLLVGLALAGLLSVTPAESYRRGAAVHQSFAQYSYSLYAIHFPLVVLAAAGAQLSGWLEHRTGPTIAGVSLWALTCTAALTMAWIFALGTERQTGRVKLWLKARPAPS